MVKKILFLVLIPLIYSKIVNLTVFQLKDTEKISVEKSSGLICYELPEKFKANTNFFLRITYKKNSHVFRSPFFYNLTDVSCKYLNRLPIDFDNLSSEFVYSIKSETEYNSKDYGYKITKTEEKQKFLLMLFYDFKGKYFIISFEPHGPNYLSFLYLIIPILIIIIVACGCVVGSGIIAKKNKLKKKKKKEFPLHPITEENNTIEKK